MLYPVRGASFLVQKTFGLTKQLLMVLPVTLTLVFSNFIEVTSWSVHDQPSSGGIMHVNHLVLARAAHFFRGITSN